MRHDVLNQKPPDPVEQALQTKASYSWRKRAKPNRMGRFLQLLISTLSFLAQVTNACYRYAWSSYNCAVSYGWYNHPSMWYYQYKTSSIADYHYYPNLAKNAETIEPPISYDSYFWCSCYQSAQLWWLDEDPNEAGWVNISSSPSSYFSWIQSFVTGSDDSTGNLTIYSRSQTETQTATFKIQVWSHYNADTGPLEWEFDVTVYKMCIDNVLSQQQDVSDINYNLLADGVSTSSATVDNIIYSRQDVGGYQYCVLTRVQQIWDGAQYVTYDTSTYPWGYDWFDSGTMNRCKFTVDWEVNQTVAGADMSLGVFYLRMWTYDPYSETDTTEFYNDFTVTFTYECQNDYFSLSGVSEQAFYIGQTNQAVGLGVSHAISNCYYTVDHYYWNNSTSAWDDLTNAPFYTSESWNSITVSANSRSSMGFTSDVSEEYYDIRVVWTSAYSTRSDDATMEERFTIRFYDRCIDDALSISTELSDITHQVSNSITTVTPSISKTQSSCSLTYSVEIYNEDKDVWQAFSGSTSYRDANLIYYSFNSGNGQLQIQQTVSEFQGYYSAPYSDHDYLIRITAEDPYSFQETKSVSDTFTLTVSYACAIDELTLSSNWGTQTVYIGGSQLYVKIAFSQIQSASSCPLTYSLEFLQDNQLYQAYSSENYVSSFSTSNGNAYFETPNTSGYVTYKPRTEYEVRVTVTSDYSTTDKSYIYDDFTLVIEDQCYTNVLTVNTSPSDIAYLIDEDGSTAAQTVYSTVTGSKGESRCPLTREVEYWDDTSGSFIAFNAGSYAWATVTDQSSSNSRIVFTVDSEDGTNLDSATIDQTLYHMRIRTWDPYSADSSNYVEETFDVSFNYECQDDYFTLSGVSMQQFYLGQSDLQISLGKTQRYTTCAYTYTIYAFNNNTSEWEAANSGSFDWYRSETHNTLTIGVSSGSYSQYRPQIYQQIKVVWKSTYSERTSDAEVEEQFLINIYERCEFNELSISTQLEDYTYEIGTSVKTFTPNFSASQSTSICPLTATCLIYSDDQDDWISCNPDPSGPWTKKDDYASRFYHSFVSANTGVYQVHYSISEYQADIAWPNYEDMEYQVKIRIEDTLSLSVAPLIEDIFTLTIQFKCAFDEITHDSSSHSNYGHKQLIISYMTGQLFQLTSGTYFAQTYSDCPLEFTLQFFNDDLRTWVDYTSEPYVESWNVNTQYYSDYGLTLGTGQLYLGANGAGMQSYDDDPWFNITAKLTVTSKYSMLEEEKSVHEDEFDISIVEQCRMVQLDSTMVVTSGGGQGVFGNPYTIDMWQLLTISMTRSTYVNPYTDPHSYTRCTVMTTLHYNDAHKTTVDTSKYLFDSTSYPTQLQIQWDYGTFDEFFIVRIQVIYDQSGKNVVVVEDEQPLYVKVSNPCVIPNGGAVVPDSIADIEYWIKDSKLQRSVPYFHDYPTDRDGGQTYLYTNGNNLCGSKTYEIVMADKSANSNTAFLTLLNTGDPMYIEVETSLPEYYTNQQITYYIKVTLDDYKDDYYDGDEEAIYYEQFLLNMRNCQIQSYNKDADFQQTYILYTPVEKIPYSAWTDNAVSGTDRYGSDCNYRVYYSVLWRDFYDTTLAIPQMVNWKWVDASQSGSHEFWIYSDDTTMVEYDRVEFIIELTGCSGIADMNPVYCEMWTLTVTVNNDCTTDTLSLITGGTYGHTFQDYTYYIDENTDTPTFIYSSGNLDHQRFYANWDTSQPYCPLDFEILRDYTDNASGQIATNYEAFKQGEGAVIQLISKMVITVPERDWSADIVTMQRTWEEQFPSSPHYQVNQVTMRLMTADYSLLLDVDGNYQDEVVWYLAVNRVSSQSNVDNSASRFYFQITLADVCHDIPLTASEPYWNNNESKTVYLWSTWTYSHRYYQIESGHSWPSVTTYCGSGFTHYMMYSSLTQGITPDDVEILTRGSAYVQNEVENLFGIKTDGAAFDGLTGGGILLTDQHWVGQHNTDLEGIHVFYIRSYIGKDGGTRQGMYPSNYKDSTYSLTLTVKNPCNDAQLTIPSLTKNVDGNQVEVLEARQWGGQVVLQYELPWSDASNNYGPNVGLDKYQLCGPLRHFVTTTTDEEGVVLFGLSQQNYNTYVAAEWLELEYFPDGDPTQPLVTYPPVFQLRINSTSSDDWGPHLLKLKFEFQNYPLSNVQNEEWHINAQVEYCLVESWIPPSNFHVPFTVGMKPISIDYIFQQFPCTYGATYSVKLIEISGIVQSNQTPPSFINQDERSGYMTVYTNDLDDLGWYVLEITATLDVLDLLGDMDELNNLPRENFPDDPDNIFLNTDLYDQGATISTGMADPATVHPKLYGKESPPDNFIYEAKFNITLGIIQVNETSITENNTAPYLLPKPKKEHKIIVGQAWELQMGLPFDWEGDNVSVYMDLRNAADFFTFDPDTLTLSLPAGVTNQQTQPVFDVKLTLLDDNEFDPLSKTYDFTLVMVKDYRDPIIEIIEQARKEEVFNDFGSRVYDLSQTSIDQVTSTDKSEAQELYVPEYKLGLAQIDIEQLKEEEDLDEQVNPKPAPVIESFSSDGVCKIRFNTPMKIPDIEDLVGSKVALRMTQAISENEISTEKYLTEEGIADFQIRNAIEVNMAPNDATEDPIPIDFRWEIISFSEYEAEIQLYFDFPESVSSSSSDPDNVVITFWAGDLFQAENGKTVRPGLTITAPVTRQIAIDDYAYYKNTGRYAGYAILGIMFLGLLAAVNINADTLPIWVTYDILVLITHLPLINVQIPGRTSVLLSEIAKVLRLSFDSWQDWYKDIDVGATDRPYTNILMHNGYMSTSIIINLFPVLCLFGALIVGLIVAKFLDCSYVTSIKEPHPNGRTEVRMLSNTQKVSNMIFRTMMVFFLEIFICILINFKAGTDSKIDFESISRVVTIFLLAILILFIMLMFLITAIESDPERDPKLQPVATIHNLYLGMSNKRRTAANIYLVSFMLRRALYAVVVIMMKNYPALQLMTLLLTSGITTAIILRGRPYELNRDKWLMTIFEVGFAWTCTLCMMFSPEYMHRSYTIASDMANAVGSITGIILLLGLVWLIYSLVWQAQFNLRRRKNLELAAELARRPRVKAKPAPLEPVQEQESEESYRMDKRKIRDKHRLRKLDSMLNLQTQEVSSSKLIGGDQDYMLDGEEPEDDGLNQLEKLAGMNQQKGVGQDLVISDDELPDNPPAQDDNESDRPNSVGAESSYSDFMQQWKNKLMTDDEKEATAMPSDMVSNHSRRSNRSNRSNNPADNSPFRDISGNQTRKLLKGQKSEVIPEMQYEESEESSDGHDNVILTKVERRRLNLLNSSRSVLPDAVAVGPSNGEVQLNVGKTGQPQKAAAAAAEEDDDFELL